MTTTRPAPAPDRRDHGPATTLPAGFARRHVGPGDDQVAAMLARLGAASLDELMEQALPEGIDHRGRGDVPPARTEAAALATLRERAERCRPGTPLIGMGYHATVTPAAIRRNLLENPAWYTAYTPYQAEISQGRLEALLHFQTMVCDLTGLDVANASLLDEATAVAEAVALAHRATRGRHDVVAVDADVHPQTLAVVTTRAEALGLQVRTVDLDADDPDDALADTFGLVVQYPGSSGQVRDVTPWTAAAREVGALAIAACDPLSLLLLAAPADRGFSIAVGSTQRFGVPLWYGGPHAGFIAVREAQRRMLPGRLVGVSVDAQGNAGLRLALQTREQHIRRERATSNICTAQSLPAIASVAYAILHGPDGLRTIAREVHAAATQLAARLRAMDLEVVTTRWFDTVTVRVDDAAAVHAAARADDLELREVDDRHVGVSFGEAADTSLVDRVVAAVAQALGRPAVAADAVADDLASPLADEPARHVLEHAVFRDHHAETEFMRLLRRWADRDLALDRSMIPLGSCTMKLNAAAELEPISWPAFADLHPFVPAERAAGLHAIIDDLRAWLAELTGFARVSLQPNAGSQGEFAGLLAIRNFHLANDDPERDVVLIPASAHGTNAASAAMAGMRVEVVACDDDGNVDLEDLRARCDAHRDDLAALMITYPSTHGVYEPVITGIIDRVHDAGGQVYFDGANLNAMVGWVRPGDLGADVAHLNLHKTFAIPHGGGGPGVGPIGVAAHLVDHLPTHPVVAPEVGGAGTISAAPWGSAGILPISWAYLAMMGRAGLQAATAVAVLAANDLADRLQDAFPVLYRGRNGRVAHECIIDLRGLTDATGVTNEDVAKRLVDYGFHAPTMSFPVPGTLMVEPTESESLREMDRFVAAMTAIRAEIDEVAAGDVAVEDSALRHAPHTAAVATADEWHRAYPRSRAAYPLGHDGEVDKYWPPVGRIDNAAGDRNPICACPPMTEWTDLV